MKANKKNGTIRQKDIFTFACLAAMCLVLLGTHGRAQAGCDEDFPCTFEIEEHQLQEVPTVFKFQSRISQAKIPVGDATFPMLIVNLRRGEDQLCQEEFADVRVRDSVLNLEIGRNMDCALDQVIAQNNSLYFQICIGSPENCLKPIALASVPYAVKSTFASQAQEAHRSDVSGQCHYAHRVTADRDMLLTNDYGTGYFDFYTRSQGDLEMFFNPMSVPAYANGGYIQWVPVDESYPNLHICSKDNNDNLVPLQELMLHSNLTTFTGDTVFRGNVSIQGEVSVDLGEDSISDFQLASDSVFSTHIRNGEVKRDDIDSDAIDGSKIDEGAVGSREVDDDSLTASDLNTDSVTADELAADSVGSSEVIDNSLTASDLHTDSVDFDEIAANAVRTSEIQDGAVTKQKISLGSVQYTASNSYDISTTNMGDHNFCALTQFSLTNTDGYCRIDRHLTYDNLTYWTITAHHAACVARCF